MGIQYKCPKEDIDNVLVPNSGKLITDFISLSALIDITVMPNKTSFSGEL